MRAARAARLFFLIRPIKFLIYGVVVAVPVVDAKTPYGTPQNDTKPPKATDNIHETNQSLGNEAHTLDTNNKHLDTIRVISVTRLPRYLISPNVSPSFLNYLWL